MNMFLDNLMLLRSKYLNYQTCMDAVGKVAADCAHLNPDGKLLYTRTRYHFMLLVVSKICLE